MSEELYRKVGSLPLNEDNLPAVFRWLVDEGYLVLVEPCEHGNYTDHIVDVLAGGALIEWCPGAAVGEETP